MVRVLWTGQGLLELVQAPRIALEVLLIFRINSFQLTIQGGREEEWSDEELGKAI